ncbi:MAG: type II secretion system F family protein [Candidatus Saganbacteria bacterium]|nr:type II secretion system F family protein [Candidatus Saganbacteria bacterium]
MLNKRQTADFCSHLRSLLSAGLPLLAALSVARGLPPVRKHTQALDLAIEKLNHGLPLSEAARELLPPPAAGALKAAEHAGDLEGCLGRLAADYTVKADLDAKLAAALVYPAFVTLISLLSVLVLIVFVLPGLNSLLTESGRSLPLITSLILQVSGGFTALWPVFLLAAVAGGAALINLKNRRPLWLERFILKTPLFGRLYRQELTLQSCGTLGSLLQGGAPLLEALRVTGESLDSQAMKAALQAAARQIENGASLSAALRGGPWPPEARQLLKLGEATGQMDRLLLSVAAFQAGERELLLKRFTALLEPAMTLGVGLIVGVVVLAMFLPLTDLVSSLQ